MKTTYKVKFSLTYPVNDFQAAKEYLEEDDMTVYLHNDCGTKYYCRDLSTLKKEDIESIKWVLEDVESGYVQLDTNRRLTDAELESILDWVCGQNSDGLGEGFEQQEFSGKSQEEIEEEQQAEWDETYEYLKEYGNYENEEELEELTDLNVGTYNPEDYAMSSIRTKGNQFVRVVYTK